MGKRMLRITPREQEVLRVLETLGLNYIARDEDNVLHTFRDKPKKLSFAWSDGVDYDFEVKPYEDLFYFIGWEDEEPTSVKELISNQLPYENTTNTQGE